MVMFYNVEQYNIFCHCKVVRKKNRNFVHLCQTKIIGGIMHAQPKKQKLNRQKFAAILSA